MSLDRKSFGHGRSSGHNDRHQGPNRGRQFQQTPEPVVQYDPAVKKRCDGIKLLIENFGIDAIASAVEMPPQRLQQLTDTIDFSAQYSMHIEEMLSLPSGWLDAPSLSTIAQETINKLTPPVQDVLVTDVFESTTFEQDSSNSLTELTTMGNAGTPHWLRKSNDTLQPGTPVDEKAESANLAVPSTTVAATATPEPSTATSAKTNQPRKPKAKPSDAVISVRSANLKLIMDSVPYAGTCLSTLTGISQPTISRLVNKPIPNKYAEKIEAALGIESGGFDLPLSLTEEMTNRLAQASARNRTKLISASSNTSALPPVATQTSAVVTSATPSPSTREKTIDTPSAAEGSRHAEGNLAPSQSSSEAIGASLLAKAFSELVLKKSAAGDLGDEQIYAFMKGIL